MRRRILLLTSAVALCLSTAALAPWASSSAAPADQSPGLAGCEIPARELLTPENTRNGIPEWAAWRASDSAQVALSQLAEAVDRRFGDTEKDSWIQLRNGYIGVAPNDIDQTVYVVVDLPSEERAVLEKDLQLAAGNAIVVRATQACNSSKDLVAAAEQLTSGSLAARTKSLYTADLDPNTATFRVAVYPTGAEGLRPFTNAVDGRLVSVEQLTEPPSRTSGTRVSDAEPHWAGAEITNERTNNSCTSGFAIDTASAGKAMVSAGHCGLVGDDFSSGTHAYGSVTRRASFPARDMLIINASDQNYDDDIYMNPIWAVGDPIDVGGTRVVTAGNHVCLSGYPALTTCNLEVVGTNAVLCDAPTGPCTENLIRYDVSEDSCGYGNSGGPVFSQWGSPTYARIVGMQIGIGSPGYQGMADGCRAHKFGTIETEFNVTVATNPG